MNLVLKGLVKLVDFVENRSFSEDLLIDYLSSFVKNKSKENFLIVYKQFEGKINDIIVNSSNKVNIEKLKSILSYLEEVRYGLCCAR